MCGCSKNSVITVNNIPQQSVLYVANLNCTKTYDELLSLKNNLLAMRNPNNMLYINSRIGLIDTMFNYGDYCMYEIL